MKVFILKDLFLLYSHFIIFIFNTPLCFSLRLKNPVVFKGKILKRIDIYICFFLASVSLAEKSGIVPLLIIINFLVNSMFYCSYITKHVSYSYICSLFWILFFSPHSRFLYKQCIPSLFLHTGPRLSSTHLAVSSLSQTGRSLRCSIDSRNFCLPTEESDDP